MSSSESPGTGLVIDGARAIRSDALEERFVRSSGPGGQNVNKVSTKVELRLDLARSGLSAEDLERIHRRLATRISSEGILAIQASEERSRERNREVARTRLVSLLRGALAQPRKRRPSRPTRGSRERRLDAKKQRGELKSRRGRRPGEE